MKKMFNDLSPRLPIITSSSTPPGKIHDLYHFEKNGSLLPVKDF
jgi:hypothetical protein